jgi:malate dehydrogenase (oxaloacetate-decarboxylating)(NADP+)
VLPNLEAANIAYNLVRVFTDGVAIGPILMGMNKPVHILTTSATSRRILNMTAIAAVDAQIRKQLEAERRRAFFPATAARAFRGAFISASGA